jgi:hypothetical protein
MILNERLFLRRKIIQVTRLYLRFKLSCVWIKQYKHKEAHWNVFKTAKTLPKWRTHNPDFVGWEAEWLWVESLSILGTVPRRHWDAQHSLYPLMVFRDFWLTQWILSWYPFYIYGKGTVGSREHRKNDSIYY